MSDLYSNDKVRERAEQLVRQNVHYCVSMLISSIAQPEGGVHTETMCRGLGLSFEDDLMPLLEITDYEEAADYYIMQTLTAGELRDYLEGQDVEFQAPQEDDENIEVEGTGTSIEELRTLAIKAAEEQGYEDFCNEFNLEPERSDVFEHWIVDDWFATKLAEKGQPIARDFLGMTIWGRPTTGQAIAMDGVILEIANELLKED